MRFSTSINLFIFTCCAVFLLSGCAGHGGHDMHMDSSADGKDEHAMHQQMLSAPAETSGEVKGYTVPAIALINQDRMPLNLPEVLNDERPVLLQFVYASCTTICPVLSAGFSSLQEKLEEEAADFRLVSITIDPEHDNPEVMKKYLDNYDAGKDWEFLTGTRKEIDTVLHAFDSYVSNKMSHKPLTFIKIPGEEKWLRLNGLMGSNELYTEFRQIHPK